MSVPLTALPGNFQMCLMLMAELAAARSSIMSGSCSKNVTPPSSKCCWNQVYALFLICSLGKLIVCNGEMRALGDCFKLLLYFCSLQCEKYDIVLWGGSWFICNDFGEAWMADSSECEGYQAVFIETSETAREALRNKKGDAFCPSSLFPWTVTRWSLIAGSYIQSEPNLC